MSNQDIDRQTEKKRKQSIRGGLRLLGRFYREYLRPNRRSFYPVCFMHVLFALGIVAPPYLIKLLIDQGITEKNFRLVVLLSTSIVVAYVLVALICKVRSYYGHIIAQRVTYHLRNKLYGHLQKLSFSFYDNIKVGELISRVIDDLNVVEEILYHGPENLITNGSVLLFTGIMVLYLDWKLALACIFVMSVIVVLNFYLSKRMFRGARKVRERKASLASRTEDNLAGIRIIKSFVREGFEMERFEQENREHYHSRMDVISPMSSLFPVSIGVLGLAFGVVCAFGGYQAVYRGLTVGSLTAFIMYLRHFMWPLLALAMISEGVTRFLAGIERFYNYMDMQPDIKDSPEAIELKEIKGDIKFRNVSFSYDDEYNLHDINLHIRPRETIALVGPSGAGKTTITRLIPRFYTPQKGEILLDDVDIRDIQIASLRDNIGIVMQDDYLFSDTLYNNIAYGRLGASEEEVYEAARQANVDCFAEQMPDGYDTQIGQRGTKVSEGQGQRISIARAILKNAPVFILDEATSSVDSHTEKLIQEALEFLMRDRTCIVIAHRLSTIVNSDRIFFVDGGRVVESGTHRELLAQGGRYAHFYRLQFSSDQDTAA